MIIDVCPDAASVTRAVADLIRAEVETGAPTLGLSGGATPRPAYELLPDLGLDWSGTTLWLADERWVPHDDADNNGAMVRAAFADDVSANLVVPNYDLGDPATAAERYTATLRDSFGPTSAPDLVLLGIGDDGHTASLFPDTDALAAKGARYVENWVPAKGVWRLTATFELLWAARELVFVVTGAAKAETLAELLQGSPLPAGRVARGARKVTWLVDEAAAEHIAVD